jgi:hypothetical protein
MPDANIPLYTLSPGSPQSNMMRLLDASPSNGAQTIVIRCGDKGALAVTRRGLHEGSILGFMLLAVEGTQVVDVTGCGNAFCGGFLASFIGMTGEVRSNTSRPKKGKVSYCRCSSYCSLSLPRPVTYYRAWHGGILQLASWPRKKGCPR